MAVSDNHPIPQAEFHGLETLWFQISGTLCNLRCTHCFISCSPDNEALKVMPSPLILDFLEQAKRHAVKEIYFTGGEPFIHREFLDIVERALRDFPVSILTNGIMIDDRRADRLQEIQESSRFSLELRISLDHHDATQNDAVRGPDTHRRILLAYKRLYDRGFLPILTVTEMDEYLDPEFRDLERYDKYVTLLRSVGVERPRIKIIPIFEMGMLPTPDAPHLVSREMMEGFDHSLLQCSSSRIVAEDGVYACPILVGEDRARLSSRSLTNAARPCSLYHSACKTCYETGMTCKNY